MAQNSGREFHQRRTICWWKEAKGTLGPRGPLVAQRWIPADQTPRDAASTNDSECPRKPTPYPPPGHRLIAPLCRPFFLA